MILGLRETFDINTALLTNGRRGNAAEIAGFVRLTAQAHLHEGQYVPPRLCCAGEIAETTKQSTFQGEESSSGGDGGARTAFNNAIKSKK